MTRHHDRCGHCGDTIWRTVGTRGWYHDGNGNGYCLAVKGQAVRPTDEWRMASPNRTDRDRIEELEGLLYMTRGEREGLRIRYGERHVFDGEHLDPERCAACAKGGVPFSKYRPTAWMFPQAAPATPSALPDAATALGVLAVLNAELDPLRESPTEPLDNIVRRLLHARRVSETERKIVTQVVEERVRLELERLCVSLREDGSVAAKALARAESAEARAETLERALGNDQPSPVDCVLLALAEASEHLLRDHDCDRHGWEGIQRRVPLARDYAAKIRRALVRETTEHKR